MKTEFIIRLSTLRGMEIVHVQNSKTFPWRNSHAHRLEVIQDEIKWINKMIEQIDGVDKAKTPMKKIEKIR